MSLFLAFERGAGGSSKEREERGEGGGRREDVDHAVSEDRG